MRDISYVFFLAAVLAVTAGMIWGIQMSISQDHTMAPAHAHLNLVGWATLALFGIYYRLTPQARAGQLPRIHAVIAILGVVLLGPGIAMAISGGTELLAVLGSLASFVSMLIFLYVVFRNGFGAVTA